jgi:hypothetical protein
MVAVRDGASGQFEAWWRGEHGEPVDASSGPAGEPVWGHGLTIVRGLAESVGVHADAVGGKVVWALLSAVPAASDGAAGHRPVRWRLMVNTGRGPAQDGSHWAVRLDLAWVPDRPDVVSLMLSSRPRHPSLPRGRWRVSRSALRDGLAGPVRHGDVRVWPDRSGRHLLLELPGDPPRMMRVSAARVRQFLTATGTSGTG